MKQNGHCITGDINSINEYTSGWYSVKMHPSTYYRRIVDIENTLDGTKGLFAELDLGEYILVRFENKEDITEFHRKHHEYI